jgi:hypothetical protein
MMQIKQVRLQVVSSAHLQLPSPYNSEKCPCVRDSSRGGGKLLGYSKAIDLHEMNERPLLGESRHRGGSWIM